MPKIGPFKERLDKLLEENEARPRRDRLRLTRVWDLLVRERSRKASAMRLATSAKIAAAPAQKLPTGR